jgi:2-amino-4-hydroxy-6-hydroxymethyldihydropteridine diphosphokinase
VVETVPVDMPVPTGLFLNMAAVATTTLDAAAVLDQLQAIERERGRERPFANAPRTLDLDLILHGETIVETPGLAVPHPRFRARAFVLEPLAEIAPDMRDPVTGLTVLQLWQRAKA